MASILNLSAYQFTPLDQLPELRERVRRAAEEQSLKGTILLSTEGINLFVAGTREQTEIFLRHLRQLPGLAELTAKESPSEGPPFRRLLVKIKREIITFGVEGIDPARRPARRLSPRVLKQWLDEGRAVTLLDTRNDYEVRLGTFRGARDPGITRFRDFPAAVQAWAEADKTATVVTFCTGGIRCEKAAPWLEREGWTDVYQLDGGILKYFELCGGAHFEGECFVFDERGGVDAQLAPTGTTLCPSCQRPLVARDDGGSAATACACGVLHTSRGRAARKV